MKNPDTGKRVSRLNPTSEWMSKERPGAADRAGRPLDRCEVASEADAARGEDRGRHRRGEAAAVPVLGSDEMRRLRRRIHHVGQEPPRMLRRTRPGTLRQPPDHPPRRSRSARAERAAGQAAAPGSVRGVLRRVHARDEPASDGAPRQPVSRRARDRAHRGPAQEAGRVDHGRRPGQSKSRTR